VMTWQSIIGQECVMRWIACMLREINLVGCSYIDIIDYTLCLMQLSVVHNLILVGCSDDISVGRLLVIDAVRWWSMYFVVMPRVNPIVILVTYARYLYSINFPTVICLPSDTSPTYP
jgi:hypothetical protein